VFIVAGDDSQMRIVVVAAWVVLPVVGELAATVVSIWTAVPRLLFAPGSVRAPFVGCSVLPDFVPVSIVVEAGGFLRRSLFSEYPSPPQKLDRSRFPTLVRFWIW